ncbi:MAG: hypothetical protein RBU30_12430 [Polyangia bacterium]|jgi:hypothetical protein|nr:hypothetical protein [Polyangia bacterium]
MRKLLLSLLCLLLVSSCKPDEDDNPDPGRDAAVPTTTLRANLKGAVLIGLVADDEIANQMASRKDRGGVSKNGGAPPLCEILTVEELTEMDLEGQYLYDCVNPDPLSYCQDIPPEKLATGRVECRQRPWQAGDLLAVDNDGEVFSVLPTLPSWNEVIEVQQAEDILLVTLAVPVKLLHADQSTDYCRDLYYTIDPSSDSIVPYCLPYLYPDPFCFGPYQRAGWPTPMNSPMVPVEEVEAPYMEYLDTFTDGTQEFCVGQTNWQFEAYFPTGPVHVTPNALFEPFWLDNDIANGDFTRIVTGDQAAMYPMSIDSCSVNGIVSGLEYYTFNDALESIHAEMSGTPLLWGHPTNQPWVFESGQRIIYGFGPPASGLYGSWVGPHDATHVELVFFDTATLEDGTFLIDISPHPGAGDPASPDPIITFVAATGDYLFLGEQDTGNLYRVDTRSSPLVIELAFPSATAYAVTHDRTVVLNGWAVNYSTRHQTDAGRPFAAFLFKPDGAVIEVNAAMLGFNPQQIELQDDQIVVTGMDGLNPRRFIINPLATEEGELLLETSADTIPVKTLVPIL